MPSYDSNAATNKVPIFGVPGTVTVESNTLGTMEGSARTWDITGISVTPGADLVEHRDSLGSVVSRTHFNLDGSTNQVNRSTTISITFIPVGADAAAALTAGALVRNGKKFTVASATVPGANGDWECTGCTASGSNVDEVSCTLNGVWHVANA